MPRLPIDATCCSYWIRCAEFMFRRITGFHRDETGDWVAELECGHDQHVRHKPPFFNRPWVTTESGRENKLGMKLNCVRCDRLELPG